MAVTPICLPCELVLSVRAVDGVGHAQPHLARASGAEIGWLGVRRSDVERHILQEAFLQHVVEIIGYVNEAGPHERAGGVDMGRGPCCCSRAVKAGFDGQDATVTHPDVAGGRLMRVAARQHDLTAGDQDVRLGFGHGFLLTNG